MGVQVLGISGSPVPNSNTDRTVRHILASTGLETEFIKLSTLELVPCRACLCCLDADECPVNDDGKRLAAQFAEADAFVLGAYTPCGSLDARTKTFMERMYCLRHRKGLNRGKTGVTVITTDISGDTPGEPTAVQIASTQLRSWMAEEGMTHLGALVLHGNVPCFRCGHGDACDMSDLKLSHGAHDIVRSAGLEDAEPSPELLEKAEELGRALRNALTGES